MRATAAVCLALTACEGNGGSSAGGGEPIELLSSDVQVVGTSGSLADVLDLEVQPDGSVWLFNSVEPFFVGFDQDGNTLGTHGQSGGGPQEFGLPSAFVAGGLDGGVWVLDLRRHSLIEISGPEGEWSEIGLPRATIPPGSVRGGMSMITSVVRTAALGSGVVLPRTAASMEAGIYSYRRALLAADLVVFDPATETARDIVTLGEVLGDPAAGFELTEGGFPMWYRLWAVCGGDEIRAYDRSTNQIRGFTLDGSEVDPVDLPPVAFTEITPRQFARAVFPLAAAEAAGAVGERLDAADSTRLMNEMMQQIEGSPAQLANYLPRYVDFRCSADGALWIQPIDLDGAGLRGGPLWFRITPRGATQEVRLPPRFDAFRFTADRIWGIQRDDLDLASVAWVAIPGAP